MKNKLLIIGMTSLLSSCAVVKKQNLSTVAQQNVNGLSVYQMPLHADVVVSSEKVSGSAVHKNGTSFEASKQLAIYNALSPVNGDVIIEPQYDVDSEGTTSTVTVTGYYGTYVNFRNAPYRKELDVDVKVQNISEVTSKKSSGSKALNTTSASSLNNIPSNKNLVRP